MPVVHSSASAFSTAGVFLGQGPSSKVSTTSLSRRKSSSLKCSKPKPGPPVVSISTVRATPKAPGVLQAARAGCGACLGAGGLTKRAAAAAAAGAGAGGGGGGAGGGGGVGPRSGRGRSRCCRRWGLRRGSGLCSRGLRPCRARHRQRHRPCQNQSCRHTHGVVLEIDPVVPPRLFASGKTILLLTILA